MRFLLGVAVLLCYELISRSPLVIMTESETLHCATHGDAQATYVCEHLAENAAQRWHCDYPRQDNPWPDAWCDRCNAEFEKQGEWNDANQGAINIKVFCSGCYERRKSESAAFMDATSRAQWDAFVSACCVELTEKNKTLWKRLSLDSYERWDWDQDTGELVFSNGSEPGAVARIVLVGSYSKKSETWLWSWANFSLVEAIREPVIAVRDYGEDNGFLPLTIPKWSAKHEDGWHMAAVAARVLGGEGAYRTPSESGFTFMVLHDVRRV